MGSPTDKPAKATANTPVKKKATAARKPAKPAKPAKKKPAPTREEDPTLDQPAEPVGAASAIVDEVLDEPTQEHPAEDGPTEPANRSRVDRVKAIGASATAKAKAARDRLEAARATSRTVDTAFGVAEHDTAVGGGVLAGAVAFRVFLFLVPYVFVVVTILALVADILGQGQARFASATGAAGIAARAVSASGDQSIWTRLVSLTVGGFALYLGASALLKVLRIIHGLVWQVPVPKLTRAPRAVGVFLLVVTGLVVAAFVISSFRSESVALFVVGTMLYITVPAGIWLVASINAYPHPEGVGWHELAPGAITVGIGFQVLQLVTVVWITHLVDSKSDTYGAIGVALALLFWAYVLGRIICAGVVINAALWARRNAEGVAGPPAGPAS
jgi:uncharacterized BrkB/YihY/UPF0761 family membrane protein